MSPYVATSPKMLPTKNETVPMIRKQRKLLNIIDEGIFKLLSNGYHLWVNWRKMQKFDRSVTSQ